MKPRFDAFWYIRNRRATGVRYCAIGTVRTSAGWVMIWTKKSGRLISLPRDLMPATALATIRAHAQQNRREGMIFNPWRHARNKTD